MEGVFSLPGKLSEEKVNFSLPRKGSDSVKGRLPRTQENSTTVGLRSPRGNQRKAEGASPSHRKAGSQHLLGGKCLFENRDKNLGGNGSQIAVCL